MKKTDLNCSEQTKNQKFIVCGSSSAQYECECGFRHWRTFGEDLKYVKNFNYCPMCGIKLTYGEKE